MNKLLSIIALAATLGTVAFAQTDDTTTTTTQVTTTQPVLIGPFMTAHNLSMEDAAAVLAIAKATGMTPDEIVTQRGTTFTGSYYDVAPAFIIAHESGKPYSDVIAMYTGGKTWTEISKDLNVPMTVYDVTNADTTNWTNTDFTNGVWTAVLEKNYNLAPTDIDVIRTSNYPWNEVVVSDVYATEVGKPWREVYEAYTTDQNDWTAVTTKYATTTQTTTTETVQTPPVETQTTTTATQVTLPPVAAVQTTTTVRPQVIKRTVVHRASRARRHTTLSRHRTSRRRTAHRRTSHKRCCCCCK